MSDWSVYLLRCADGSLYCGITTDMARRLRQHNEGKAAAYTRSRRPVAVEGVLLYDDMTGKPFTRSAALQFEYGVKQMTPAAKMETFTCFT